MRSPPTRRPIGAGCGASARAVGLRRGLRLRRAARDGRARDAEPSRRAARAKPAFDPHAELRAARGPDIVGDDASPETISAIRGVSDPRVRFLNVTTRVVRQPPELHWHTAKTLPLGEAYGNARGQWMLEFDDDDSLLPGAIGTLIELARTERAEVAYGQIRRNLPDGSVEHGVFPPEYGRFSLAAAVVHAGLRFFTRAVPCSRTSDSPETGIGRSGW